MKCFLSIFAIALLTTLVACVSVTGEQKHPVTVDARGYPVYDSAPLPTYDEGALTDERRNRLESEIPDRLKKLKSALEGIGSRLDVAFEGKTGSFQYERILKRREMASKLCRYIAHQHAKGTVSGLCQAETGIANLEAFVRLFEDEKKAWETYPEAPGVAAEEFNVRDFGATGDGVTDDEPAFQRAFARIRQLDGKPCVLRIPSGSYLLNAKPNPANGKPAIWFSKVSNCIVSGDDPARVKLVFGSYDGNGINFRDWENSTLRNVQVFWRETPFVQGEIESVDQGSGSLVLRHQKGTLLPDDPRLARIGHPNSCMQFDRTGVPIRSEVLWYDYHCQRLGEGRYRLFFGALRDASRAAAVRPGTILVVPDRNNSIEALQASNSRFFTFDRVWVRNSRCGAFCPGMSYQPTVVRCRIFPKEPQLCLSTNADGNYTSPGTAIMHCDFVNMNDDGSNAHGMGQIFTAYDAQTGKYQHGSNWGWERPGDFVQILSSLDGRYLMNTRVESVEYDALTRERQCTVFADALPPTVKSYTSLGIKPYDYLTRRKIMLGDMKTALYPDQFYVPFAQGVGYVCWDNHFANIRGVAIQVQSPCALVESNRIENVYRGIELSGLLHYQEGPPPYNVTLRGNVIRDVNLGVKSCFMTLNHPPAVTTPMSMILIEDNVIAGVREHGLVLQNAEDVLIRNNKMTDETRPELRICRNVRFSSNTFGGRPLNSSDLTTDCVVSVTTGE